VAGLAALALAPGSPRALGTSCAQERPRNLPGAAVELPAGDRLWSAWITYPPVVGETITVLWRAEGFVPGPFRVTGTDGSGHRLAVEFGPSPVLPQLRGGGLRWPRVGREWGTHVRFSHPGCWRLQVDAGDRRGDLALWVRRPA
jgi:hypothetical protein